MSFLIPEWITGVKITHVLIAFVIVAIIVGIKIWLDSQSSHGNI